MKILLLALMVTILTARSLTIDLGDLYEAKK